MLRSNGSRDATSASSKAVPPPKPSAQRRPQCSPNQPPNKAPGTDGNRISQRMVLVMRPSIAAGVTDWRRARDAGAISGLNPANRGPKIAQPNPLAADNARLRHDNADLTLRLTRAEAIIDIQKSCVPAGYTPGPQRQRALTGAIVALAPA